MFLKPYSIDMCKDMTTQIKRHVYCEINEYVEMMKAVAEHHLNNAENDVVKEYAETELKVIEQVLEEIHEKRWDAIMGKCSKKEEL